VIGPPGEQIHLCAVSDCRAVKLHVQKQLQLLVLGCREKEGVYCWGDFDTRTAQQNGEYVQCTYLFTAVEVMT